MIPCYFCGRPTDNECVGCGYAICPDCDHEVLTDETPHDPEAHRDDDDEGYEE
jgi:hypothetical protein